MLEMTRWWCLVYSNITRQASKQASHTLTNNYNKAMKIEMFIERLIVLFACFLRSRIIIFSARKTGKNEVREREKEVYGFVFGGIIGTSTWTSSFAEPSRWRMKLVLLFICNWVCRGQESRHCRAGTKRMKTTRNLAEIESRKSKCNSKAVFLPFDFCPRFPIYTIKRPWRVLIGF